ncbi:hypothetical protein ACFW31_24640 [Nocardiopsis alba]|uniref:hypothetical protein n=1 Tax=Nocardiopsis alba TaxID=53437 RepID=UPI003672A7E6
MNLRTAAGRISHGTKHIPAPALFLRIAVVLFGAGTTLTVSDPVFGLLAAAITTVAGAVTLWELHDAAVECDGEAGEDGSGHNESGFGEAA